MKRLCVSVLAGLVAAGAAVVPAGATPVHAALRIDIAAMTKGQDGNVWFADGAGNAIGRVSRAGVVTIFQIPFLANPRGIAAGPGGALYFSERQGGGIGRITTSGTISQISLPTKKFVTDYIASGPNNTLWFVYGNDIGELTGSLKFILHKLQEPRGGSIIPMNLAVARYGNVWFNDFAPYPINGVDHHALIRLTPQGSVTAYPVTYGSGQVATGLAVGPDGNLWYTLSGGALVGRATPSGQSTVFQSSRSVGLPQGIASGPRQSVWLTSTATTTFSRTGTTTSPASIEAVTSTGKTTVYPLSPQATIGSYLGSITAGADGNLWFPEVAYTNGVVVGATMDRMTPGGQLARFPIPGVAPLKVSPKIRVKVQLIANVQRGATQSIEVLTAPNAQIAILVAYPQSGSFSAAGTANAQGIWQDSWTVGASNTGIATVNLTVQSAGVTRHFTKHFFVL